MVKEHTHTETIPRCSVKDFFEILYVDDEAAKAYHKEADNDENTQVEAWQGNTRTVHFTMPMQLPAVLTKMIGTDAIPVKEVQQAEIDSSGALHVTSTPIIGVPGGSKFQAVARLTVTNSTQSGVPACQVVAKISCTADGPWGFQGMIEAIMIEQSAASVKGYLAFCSTRCQSVIAEQGVGDGPGSPRSDATAFEQFFDAQESISRMSSIASSQGLTVGLPTTEVLDTIALLQLLDTLEGRLGLLSADIAAVRALVPLRDGKGLSPKVSPTAIVLGPWALGFLCGAAAVAAACVVLRRQGRL